MGHTRTHMYACIYVTFHTSFPEILSIIILSPVFYPILPFLSFFKPFNKSSPFPLNHLYSIMPLPEDLSSPSLAMVPFWFHRFCRYFKLNTQIKRFSASIHIRVNMCEFLLVCWITSFTKIFHSSKCKF